ncbi:MAG: hypothetical protein AB7I59_02685 [Geminicoccaceae bacterium]
MPAVACSEAVPSISSSGSASNPLAVFVGGLVVARLLGIMLDNLARDVAIVALDNLLGVLSLVLIALRAQWFKQPPWRGGWLTRAGRAPPGSSACLALACCSCGSAPAWRLAA